MLTYIFFFFISFLSGKVIGSGEFIILQSPPSVKFEGSENIDADVIADVLSLNLGFTPTKTSTWSGLTIKNPFDLAEAIAVVAIEGVSTLGSFPSTVARYPIHTDVPESDTWRDVLNAIMSRFPDDPDNALERVELGVDIVGIDTPRTKSLSMDRDEDVMFLQDVTELNSRVKEIATKTKIDGVPDLYWFVMHSLHVLKDVHGANHPATLEANEMIKDSLVKMAEELTTAFKKRILVVAIVSDGSHTRQTRQAPYDGTSNDTVQLPKNLATVYSEDYPAIFNIILWFTVAFVFALIAITYFIAGMDPGRDSIIYRMTSNRIKKDN